VRLAEAALKSGPDLVDKTLFYVPDRASFVFTRSLQGLKGSDASNIYDEEINEEVRSPFLFL
jgi:H/ACA ribonucleoprotein complex non-core subunit NAF1